MIFVWGQNSCSNKISEMNSTGLFAGEGVYIDRVTWGQWPVVPLSPASAYFHFLSSVCPYIALVLTTLKQSQLVMICAYVLYPAIKHKINNRSILNLIIIVMTSEYCSPFRKHRNHIWFRYLQSFFLTEEINISLYRKMLYIYSILDKNSSK